MLEAKLKDLIPESVPVYIGDLPSSPSNIASIMMFNDVESLGYFGYVTLYTIAAKIVVRNKSYEKGHDWCMLIKDALHGHTDDTFLSITLQGYPAYLGRDEQKLHEFQLVFYIKTKE